MLGIIAKAILSVGIKLDSVKLVTFAEKIRSNAFEKDEFGNLPLDYAVSANANKVTEYLLGKNNENQQVFLGEIEKDLLFKAIKKGDEEFVKKLIKLGVDINSTEKYPYSPLLYALHEGKWDVANILLDAGCDPNPNTYKRYLKSYEAVFNNNKFDLLKFIFNKLADTEEAKNIYNFILQRGWNSDWEWMRLDSSTKVKANFELVKFLVKNSSDIDMRDKRLVKICGEFVRAGDFGAVKMFLNKGMSADSYYKHGNDTYESLLNIAIQNRHFDIAEFLVESGANVNRRTGVNDSAISLTIEKGNLKFAKYLIGKGVDLRLECYKYDPLILQAMENEEFANFLIDSGAHVDVKTGAKIRAIHMACEKGLVKTVAKLILKRSDLSLTDSHGKTPVDMMLKNGEEFVKKVVDYVIKHGDFGGEKALEIVNNIHIIQQENEDKIAEVKKLKNNIESYIREKLLSTRLHLFNAFIRNLELPKLINNKGEIIEWESNPFTRLTNTNIFELISADVDCGKIFRKLQKTLKLTLDTAPAK